jgi:flagellar basal-body rod protein FlgF
MHLSTYVNLSGQVALERRMATIAQNIANAQTVGYRADRVTFESVMADTAQLETTFVSDGETYLDETQGSVKFTGNPLDVALTGPLFLGVTGPSGTYYSKDGRLSTTVDGTLVNIGGDVVQDSGGSAISIDAALGQVTVSGDGWVMQQGRRVAQLGLFEIDTSRGYTRMGSVGVVPESEARPVEDFTGKKVMQGYVEESNVDSLVEMTRLIEVSRAFEAVSNMLESAQQAESQAIRTLGG